MGRHPTETCMKRTQTIMRGIRSSFTKLQGGTWLVAKRMDFDQDHTTHTYANRVLRSLVEHKVLERVMNPAHRQGVEWLYRPTVAGYQLLEAIDNFPLEELHSRYGYPTERIRKRSARPARLPSGFSTRTLGSGPDAVALRHLLEQVNKLAAEVDGLKARLAQPAVGATPAHSSKNGLSTEVLAAIGKAVLDGRAGA